MKSDPFLIAFFIFIAILGLVLKSSLVKKAEPKNKIIFKKRLKELRDRGVISKENYEKSMKVNHLEER
jgi:hypothetical protein